MEYQTDREKSAKHVRMFLIHFNERNFICDRLKTKTKQNINENLFAFISSINTI